MTDGALALGPLPVSERTARAFVGLLAVLVVAGLIGAALSPLLLVKSPLLLILLSADARHVLLAVGRVAPWALVAVTILRRSLFSVACYGMGALYGETTLAWVDGRHPTVGKWLRYLEVRFARFGFAILVLLPFATVCVVAGAARMRLPFFLGATVLGQALWVAVVYALGSALSDYTNELVGFFSRNLLVTTLVCLALVALQQLRARRKQRPPFG